jgi:cytidylate kinase
VKTYIKFFEDFERKLSKKIRKKGLTITVSGLAGAGKSLGARAIAKALKLKYISAGEIQREIAEEKGISLEEQVRIRGPEVDHEMDRRSLKFAMEGNVVLDGRLTGWVAGDWADVRVWYKCPLEIRAERVAKRDNTSIEEARKRLKERDEEDHRKYSELYGIDSYDESIYDVTVDNGKLTIEEARIVPVRLVKEFLKKKNLKQKT